MVAQMPDLVVTDQKRWPTLAIEIQAYNGFDVESAIEFRKESVPDLAIAGRVPYLMLTSEDRAYVWLTNDRSPADAPPSLEIDMRPIVRKYYESFRGARENGGQRKMGRDQLLLYLRYWIEDLIGSVGRPDVPPAPSELVPVFEQMKGGRVEMEASPA